MAARKTGLELPLPLQFLAAWLAVWLGRVLQEQVDFLKSESLIVANDAVNGTGKVVRRDRLGSLLSFHCRRAA